MRPVGLMVCCVVPGAVPEPQSELVLWAWVALDMGYVGWWLDDGPQGTCVLVTRYASPGGEFGDV